ncbi:hypothetical protein [Christiangramia sabulilitoris]|uniref:Uncharacterized protein n=1 Tax=Christiangramia sabulilitoris TaxID=2583991 RepID=A0A550I0P6_9FLAO|nr:hypothetical protein [Christiangramia sabulilitoris]TRO64510.1 hypothetical protein FGM01_13555 [Christiangramia sabulilitoris]
MMKNKLNSNRIFKISKSIIIILIINFSTSCSFTRDNAVNLAYELEAAAETLKSQKIGNEFVINFEPIDSEATFTILMFSENGVTFNELIEKGLDSLLVEDLYPQLDYINLKNRATSVVYQNGAISFTTYYRRFVDVAATQIINGKGNTDIIVKSIGVGPGNITDEVLLIELQ